MKRALVIGIDKYDNAGPLQGCVNDAKAIAALLGRDGTKAASKNFDVRLFTSDKDNIDSAKLQTEVERLFKGAADVALLFFAGHGVINQATESGFLVSQDGKKPNWGMAFQDILALHKQAEKKIKTTVIILDTCNSGALGEVPAIGNASVIENGVTILTSTHRDDEAMEGPLHGAFTNILIDGLKGGCADIRGNITPAALYTHVDQSLSSWEQRPVYKANVSSFVVLRKVDPKVPDAVLRKFIDWFPQPGHEFPLDPSYEPDRLNIPEHLRHLPRDPDHEAVFKQLQVCNRHGLVEPVGAEHMYYAAIESKSCRLTMLGEHYRQLAKLDRL
jgi:uncharacterized caspase-like protein